MTQLASYAIPIILAAVGLLFLISKKDLFDEFLQGAKDGLKTSINLLPTLIILIVAISMFRASGALDIMSNLLSPLFQFLGIPKEVAPFVIMRPLSGSGSTALLTDIFASYGPDSNAGRIASVIMASSDTVFYVFAVYFGSVGAKKTKYALLAALCVHIFCCVLAANIGGIT